MNIIELQALDQRRMTDERCNYSGRSNGSHMVAPQYKTCKRFATHQTGESFYCRQHASELALRHVMSNNDHENIRLLRAELQYFVEHMNTGIVQSKVTYQRFQKALALTQ